MKFLLRVLRTVVDWALTILVIGLIVYSSAVIVYSKHGPSGPYQNDGQYGQDDKQDQNNLTQR